MPWAVLADQEKRDTNAIVELIASQTARVTAVVGGALLDEHVRRTLSERLRESGVSDWLLKPDNPIGTLGPRIDLTLCPSRDRQTDAICTQRRLRCAKPLRTQSWSIAIV
jgi:hypothetical protein